MKRQDDRWTLAFLLAVAIAGALIHPIIGAVGLVAAGVFAWTRDL